MICHHPSVQMVITPYPIRSASGSFVRGLNPHFTIFVLSVHDLPRLGCCKCHELELSPFIALAAPATPAFSMSDVHETSFGCELWGHGGRDA